VVYLLEQRCRPRGGAQGPAPGAEQPQDQDAGAFRRDLPKQWLVTTAFSLMHAAAEDAAAGRIKAEDAPRLITATLLAALTPPVTEG
jgi:hypothetical protein